MTEILLDRIGPYRALEQIGTGGMSRVFLAQRDDDQFHQQVAIKLIDGPAGDVAHRFRTERQILAGFEHPHIAHLLDGGETDDARPYFVLEFVDGVHIDQYCRQHRLNVRERLELFLQVASALSYAHRNLIVHRDVKPSNILVTRDGVAKLLDFGIAKILEPQGPLTATEPTITGQSPMTLQYASPEQILGRPITTATDIYGLGLLLYEILAERRPYLLRDGDLVEIVKIVGEREVTRPSVRMERGGAVRPEEVEGDLDAIVLTALAADPSRRYATVQQMADDVRLFLDDQPLAMARPSTFTYRLGKLIRRHAVASAATIVGLTMLLTLVLALAVQSQRLTVERDRAQSQRDRAEAVSSFLADVFSEADPYTGGNPDVTARQILDAASKRLGEDLRDQPLTRADLLTVIGRVYLNLRLYKEAEPLLVEGFTIRQEQGESVLKLTESLYQVALTYRKLGQFERSEDFFKRCLELQRTILPEDAPAILQVQGDLAYLYKHMARYDLSESLLKDVINIREREGSSRDLTENYIQISNLYMKMGELNRSLPYHFAIEDFFEAAGDVRGISTAHHNLALAYLELGDLEKAGPLLEDSYAYHRKTYGVHHYTASSASDLSSLRLLQGLADEPRALAVESVRLIDEVWDGDNPLKYEVMKNAVWVHLHTGARAEAEMYLKRFEAICQTQRVNHHCAAEVALFATQLHIARDDVDSAADACVQAHATVSSSLEVNPHDLNVKELEALVVHLEATLLRRRGDDASARDRLDRALAITGALLEKGNASVADLHVRILVDLGRLDEARPLAAELWAKGWRHPDFVETVRRYGLVDSGAG